MIDRFSWQLGSDDRPAALAGAPQISKGRYVHSYLSNFFPCRLKFEAIIYPSVEHAYQAAKTWNLESRAQIAMCPSAGRAKNIGRTVELRDDWDEVKLAVMGLLCLQKFTLYENLRRALIDSGDVELVEGNDWGDTFWGCVWREGWQGENELGKTLMGCREILRRIEGDPSIRRQATLLD